MVAKVALIKSRTTHNYDTIPPATITTFSEQPEHTSI